MDFSNFLVMQEELSLLVVMILLFLYDLFAPQKARSYFSLVACLLFTIHIFLNLIPGVCTEAFGGMYLYTPAMSIIKTVMNIGTLLVFLQAHHWVNGEEQNQKQGEFYFLTLSTLLGMYFMIAAGHFMLFFIGMETASIPMAALVAFNKYEHKSAEAGAKYILSAAFASGISLFGLSLLYGSTGTLYFNDILLAITGSPLQIAAMILFLVGLFFKLSLVPFHLWTADVYEGAPTPITSYLSVVSKACGAFVIFCLFAKVFSAMILQWQTVIYILIILSITVGNLFAIRQKNIKRFLAYSSISQAGYIMLGVVSASPEGLTSLIYYVFVYMLSNLGAFAVVSLIEQKSGNLSIEGYNGLYKTNPKLSVLMMFSLFSLAGIPPFAGFFSKFFIFASAAQQGFYVLVFIALLNTIISLYYYLLVVKAMFINPNEKPIPYFKSDLYSRIGLIVCLLGIVGSGLFSGIYGKMQEITAQSGLGNFASISSAPCPKGTLCQSCGIPIENNSLWGTNADGTLSTSYCKYCFANGSFLQNYSLEEMIQHCTKIASKPNKNCEIKISSRHTEAHLRELLPQLKRWKTDSISE